TADGGEIGRAQAVQAAAAGVEPTLDMNPILVKPEADDRSQIVVRGRAVGSLRWREYSALAPVLWSVIADSLGRLRAAHDLDGIARDIGEPRVVVAVPRLPRIANFDDLEPLAAEPGVAVRFASRPETLADADVVVLPGSKTTVADLAWLRDRRLDGATASAARDGRVVIGICGGYQMLGEHLDDPDHVESDVASARGL